MEGTSAAEAAHRCHCIAAVKPLRHPKTRKCLRLPSLNQKDEELRFFWQVRYYDFPVWTEAKRIEKLRYIHRNSVRRGLAKRPEDWKWNSFVHYATGRKGLSRSNRRGPPAGERKWE
jgi:hypothetical protein